MSPGILDDYEHRLYGGSAAAMTEEQLKAWMARQNAGAQNVFAPKAEPPRVAVPTDAKARKALPLFSGVLNYFPDALLAVAEVSRIGNDQHNPGQPLHWAKEKSTDEADALARHLLDHGKLDSDGIRHSAKVAWRALALLQREIEGTK